MSESFRSRLFDRKSPGSAVAETYSIAYSRPAPGPGRLLVDVSYQNNGVPGSGIARVVDRILGEFNRRTDIGMHVLPVAAIGGHPHYRVASNYCRRLGLVVPGQDNAVIDLRAGEYFLSLDLNHMIDEQAPFIERLHALGGKSCGVVYDLLPIQRPDWFLQGVADHHRRWLDTLSTMDRLACISHAVADEVREHYRRLPPSGNQPTVASFHLGCDLPATASGSLPDELGKRPSFLLVSLLNPRKGQLQTLRAFEHLWAQGLDANLVYAGRDGWGSESVLAAFHEHPEMNKRLFWFNGPSDGKLELLYQSCSGVIVASEGEGFGLPVVEALQHAKPVLARDLPVLREVGGARARYFKGLEASHLADALKAWIADIAAGKVIGDKDFRPLTWSQSAAELLAVMGIVPRQA